MSSDEKKEKQDLPHRTQSARFDHNEVRYDPVVVAELERWWEAASEDPDIIFAQEHGDDALNFKQ